MAPGGLCRLISKLHTLLMVKIRWGETRSFLTLPKTTFSLSLSFLRSSRFLPPTFTTLHWNYPQNHQSSRGTTIASCSKIPKQEWYMGPPTHGTSPQALRVVLDHVLGHPVVNSLQCKDHILWKYGMPLPLKNAQTSNVPNHTLTLH